MAETQWLTVQDVADRIKLHPETVRRMLKRGDLPGRFLGRRPGWRISEADLEVFMRQNRRVAEKEATRA